MIRLLPFILSAMALLASLPATAPAGRPAAGASPSTVVYAPIIILPTNTPTPDPNATATPGPSPTLGPTSTPIPPGQDGWFQFRRDAQRTAATGGSLSGPLQIRWKRGFTAWPSVFAELTVAGDRVYVANTDGKLTALRADDGSQAWEYNTGAALLGTPAIGGSRIHVVNIAGRVVTLDAGTGQLIWERQLPSQVYASPALSGGRLFVGTIGGVLYALDAAKGGSPLWSYSVPAMIDAAPTVALGRVIFAAEDMHAYALNVSDGTLAWKSPLPGASTWNAHPVASEQAGRVFFSTQTEFYQPSSSHREVIDMYQFEDATGPLHEITTVANQFVSQNRAKLQPATILNISDGSSVTGFSVATSNVTIEALPYSSWYWGSIRPALWQGNKLVLQSMWRTIIVDLAQKRIYQPNSNNRQTGHFVRGDEQVPISIGRDALYGGIGTSVSALSLLDGARSTLLGASGSETGDRTPLTAPLDSEPQHVFPGNGYSDRIGTLIVVGSRAYYQQYGWVYCLETAP